MTFTATISPSPVCAAFSGISWDPLGRLRLTDAEKSLLRSGEDNPVDYTLSNIEDACLYVQALLKVLVEASGPSGPSTKVSHLREELPTADALQILYTDATGVVTHYAIAKLHEVIVSLRERRNTADVNMSSIFFPEGKLIESWRPLLRILHLGGSGDPFAQRVSALCLSYILIMGCPSQSKSTNNYAIDYSSVKEPLQALLSWITSQLQASSGSSLSLVTPTLITLMNCTEARQMFVTSGGIGYISRHLRSKPNTNLNVRKKAVGASAQQLYELCFSLWALTYECVGSPTVRAAFARDGAIRALTDLISSSPREKVVRVAISALRNLAECHDDDLSHKSVSGSLFLNDMITCGLMKSIVYMMERQWTDPDILDDLKAVNKMMNANYKEMSRWDLYESEIESGQLKWGIIHTDKFFRENNRQLEGKDGNFYLLKRLISLIKSDDEEIAAVACYDLGEFVRHYPNGRVIAKQLGAREPVMTLIEHENPELQHHALQCISKMMVQNWSAIQ